MAFSLLAPLGGWSAETVSTLCVLAAGVAWLLQLGWICFPLNALRGAVWGTMILGFVVCVLFFPGFFSLVSLSDGAWIALLASLPVIPLMTWFLACILRRIPWFRRAREAQ